MKHDLLEQWCWTTSIRLYGIGVVLLALLTGAWWKR